MLASIREHGSIRLDTRQAVAFWGKALDALQLQGLVDVEFRDNEQEQCSYYIVRLKPPAKPEETTP